MEDRLHEFAAAGIRVTWSRTRCIHAAACIAGLPDVFVPGERPWIRLAGADVDEIAHVVTRCPTGALHFVRTDGGAAEGVPARNLVRVVRNGPIYVHGDVEVRDGEGRVLLRDTRVALCRCGVSGTKPLCDDAHAAARFQDAAELRDLDAVEDDGTPAPPGPDGPLVVTAETNGPLRLEGRFVIASGDATTVLEGTRAWLCRCGRSATKPFCDGSHERTGFREDARG